MFDSLENLFEAAKNIRDFEYFLILDSWLEEYCETILDWEWAELPMEDRKFLEKNPEWEEYILGTFFEN